MECPPCPVSLSLPANPEFVLLVRLTISGFAYRLNFSYEEIEDIKLAVSEACNSVISHSPSDSDILMECRMEGDDLEILVKTLSLDKEMKDLSFGNGRDMGLLLIKALMDEAEYRREASLGAVIRMKKARGAEKGVTSTV